MKVSEYDDKCQKANKELRSFRILATSKYLLFTAVAAIVMYAGIQLLLDGSLFPTAIVASLFILMAIEVDNWLHRQWRTELELKKQIEEIKRCEPCQNCTGCTDRS